MDEKRPAMFYSYSTKTTSVSYLWPPNLTGLERIALSAKGDLQRVLSAFFARPITIATVYANTFYHPSSNQPAVSLTLPNPPAIASASLDQPITQTRQVYLQCSGKTVCTATSTVRITSPRAAHLFLEEKYAIGQMFVRMEKVPEFELVAVGLGTVTDASVTTSVTENIHQSTVTPPPIKASGIDLPSSANEELWRKYRLFMPGFECDILEVFPSRDMFVMGQEFLDEARDSGAIGVESRSSKLRPQALLTLFLGFGFAALVLSHKLSAYLTGHSVYCNM